MVEVGGTPLVVHAVTRMQLAGCDPVVVAAPAHAVELFAQLLPEAIVVAGGEARQASVAAALRVLPPDIEVVLVHDAARGLAPAAVAETVIAAVRAGADAVVPVLPLADTVKEVDSAGWVRRTLDRAALRAVQTPQGFRRLVLERAHQSASSGDSLDDASLVEALGLTVRTVPGDPAAMKITTPTDLLTVAALAGLHVG